jgi:hypothetical protein
VQGAALAPCEVVAVTATDSLADAFQALLDLIERYGGERIEEQQAMWGQIEDAVQAVGEQGVAAGCREATAKTAEEIRRELVCCHIYDAVKTEAAGDEVPIRGIERTGHGICFWGEASAQIAEEVGRGER